MGRLLVVIGALLGLAGAAPGLVLATMARRGRRVSVAAGLGATLVSTGALTVALGWAFDAAGSRFVPMALAMVGAFLGAWAVESVLAWRWMRRWR